MAKKPTTTPKMNGNALKTEQIGNRSEAIVLVHQKAEPRVDSRLIAKQLAKQHRSVYRLIADHQEDHETFGILRFEIAEIDGRGQPERFALLNEDQCYLLLTHTRNTEQTRRLKVALVKAFGDARRATVESLSRQTEPGWQLARTDSKVGHHLIGFALKTSRQIAGKETAVFHYQNEAKLIRFALTGTQDPLCRDCLSRDELKILARVEHANAEMIAVGEGYQLRKAKCRVLALQLLSDLERRGRSLIERNGLGRGRLAGSAI